MHNVYYFPLGSSHSTSNHGQQQREIYIYITTRLQTYIWVGAAVLLTASAIF
jgi:hypothetical protein